MSLAHKILPEAPVSPLSDRARQTLASLHLESFVISDEIMEDIRLFDAGKITKQELLARALKRAQA
ncbi:MAG: hypothetical protein K2Q14_03680 [Gammaproteobacteria bacterium]|nr:hypothetical protein [Gammaproteobacteria bacterium]